MSDWELIVHTVGPLQVNAYILTDRSAGEAVLVDPGYEAPRLLAAVEATGCRLTHLLCTHGHFDHIGDAAAIQERFDLPLRCHPAESTLVARMPHSQEKWGFPPSPMPRVTGDLDDGHEILLGGRPLTVRHVPGHSPGGVLFVWDEEALVGDLIFHRSVGRTDFPDSSHADLERSIRTQVYTLPDGTRLHPGHGPSTTVAEEKRENPFVRP